MTGSHAATGTGSDFTHLEVHSHFSLLGATAPVKELVARASAGNFSHLALADSNALYGSVAFHKACLREDIEPILGMTVSTALPPEIRAGSANRPGHLLLLAKNRTGYRSLCRISSIIQGTPERDAILHRGIGWSAIAENTAGLICLSGGRNGWIDRLLRDGQVDGATRYASMLGGAFGEDAALSLEIHTPEDIEVAQEIANLGNRFGLKTAAVQPIYYLEPDDWSIVQLLNAIDKNMPLQDIQKNEPAPGGRQDHHWLEAAEVAARFDRFPDALSQIGEITKRCQPSLPDGRPIWPVLKLPEDKAPDQALAEFAWTGLFEKYGPVPPEKAKKRLESELLAIGQTGYTPLFIIVADIVRYARESGVPVSTRGSVANSLVAYCTGITTVDPITHDLLFERFLNPARSSPPDIDLDFCSRRRDEILDYVRQTYGKDQVALVATVSTLRPKSAVRETGKALGLDGRKIGRLAKSLPRTWHPDPRRRSKRTVQDLLAELDDPELEEVVVKAYELVGQPHHLSVHPGGVVITPGPLTDFVPVQLVPKGFLITQFDYRDLESLGLPKLDLLGISALTVMADAADLVRLHYDPRFALEDIPLQDGATGDLLQSGETIGVFQCESSGSQRTLRQLQARTVPDLAVANAFFKPGPATGGMAKAFIRRYRGEEEVRYLHPTLEPILAPTKGVLLFQEQILRVATEIAALDWQQANQLRRGMSKFRADEMEALQSRFIAGCELPPPKGPGFTPVQAQTLWEQVRAFAGYGFNQGHATAYADVSYRSAFLKTHWPAAYFCARLADWGGFHHPAIYTAEAVRLGITVRPPHVNYSNRKFTLTFTNQGLEADPHSPLAGPVLWAGLSQIRDLRRKTIRQIIHGRSEKPYDSLEDLLERVPLQMKEITHLIQCGALDGLGPDRAALLSEADGVRRAGSTRQMAFTFDDEPRTPPDSPADRLKWERHILGRPFSVHPLDLVETRMAGAVSISDLPATGGRRVTVTAVRLPGWTGGSGYFIGDQKNFIIARADETLETPPAWIPLIMHGRWLGDEWATHWFQVDELQTF